MFVKQLSVFIENREGRLEQVTEVLKEQDINILSVSYTHLDVYKRQLLELGHTRIGCVGGPKDLADSNRRTQGYIRALMEKGVEFDPSLIFYGDYDLSSGVRGAEYLLKKDVTAIFAYNDMSAYGVFHYLKQQGISVPEDISLIGYDDIFFSEILSVPLTSIHQPVEEMGTEAVQQMIRIIRQKQKQDTKKNIMFQPYLVVRQSTAAPAGVMHI